MAFKFFKFLWGNSPERKELLALKIKEQDLKNDILEYQIKKQEEKGKDSVIPYKKILYNNDNITVVLHNSVVLSKAGVTPETFKKVKAASSVQEIEDLLLVIQPISQLPKELYSEEEIKFVESSCDILREYSEFIFKEGKIYLKGVNLPIEPVVLSGFIELAEKIKWLDDLEMLEQDLLLDQFEALCNFWRWTALNPIESSRQALFQFCKQNDISINKDGMLELYRRIVNVGNENKALVQFISQQYFKIKKWKKSAKNYFVFTEDDGTYSLSNNNQTDGISKLEGNLEDLYLNLPNMAENIYTDGHTGKKQIRIGQVYKEDEDKIDLNNNISCSKGLKM